MEHWETLSTKGDEAVQSIADDLKEGKISLHKAFERLSHIDKNPEEYGDAEIAKETVNNLFDFIEKETRFDVEDAVDIYQRTFFK